MHRRNEEYGYLDLEDVMEDDTDPDKYGEVHFSVSPCTYPLLNFSFPWIGYVHLNTCLEILYLNTCVHKTCSL